MLSNNNNQVKTKNGENDLYDEKLVALFRPEMLGKRKGKDKKNSHTQASERIIEAAEDDTYECVLTKLGVNPVEVVVLHNGKPVPEDETVDKSDITVIRIVSGG